MTKNNEKLKKIFNQAVENQKGKKFNEALNLYFKVLEIYPNDLATLNNIGNVYKDLKKYNKSIQFYNKAHQLNRSNLITNYNIAILYLLLDRLNESIKFFNEVLKIDPTHHLTMVNLMEIYDKTNNKEELEKTILKAENLSEINSEVTLYKSRLLIKKEKYESVIKNLEPLTFSNNKIRLEQLRVLSLGKAYDQLNLPDKAFDNFSKLNEISLKLKNKSINKDNYLKEIFKRIDYFKAYKKTNIAKNKNEKKNSDPVFLIGFPRSGTTLLDTILRSHNSIEVIEEKPLVEKTVFSLNKMIKNDFNNLKKLKDIDLKNLQNIYYEELKKNISDKKNIKIYIDKLPLNIIHVGEILKIFPQAKFIFSLRHPCDCVLSCFMQNFKINNAMANFLSIEDSANIYENVMNLWKVYTSNLKFNFKEIKYENLIDNFEETIKSLTKFLNLPWDQSVLNYHQTAKERLQIKTPSYDQVIKPIYQDANGRWKKYQKFINPVYPKLEKWIKRFDY